MTVTEQAHTPTRRSGPAPFGWEWDRGRLVPVPREQSIRWLILHLRAAGWSLRKIAAELERLQIPTRAGLRTWPTMTLQRVTAASRELDAQDPG